MRSAAGLRVPNLAVGPARQLVGELGETGLVAAIEANQW
jgi:hypothetical protein